MKCSGLPGNESQVTAPTPDMGLPLSGDGEEEEPFLKGDSNWLEIKVEEKNDDEPDLGVRTEWGFGRGLAGLGSCHMIVTFWLSFGAHFLTSG